MKLTELLLLEYDRDITSKKFGSQIETASSADTKADTNSVLSSLEDMDPTKNKQYVQWLVKQYIKKLFRLEDGNRVKQVLVDFDKLKPRLPEKDINRFTFHELESQIDKVLNPELNSTDSKEGNFEVPEDAEVLYSGPLGQLTSPKTEEAACELGKGTKWCTSSKENNMFSRYNEKGKLYIWRDRDGSKYQFHFKTSQFMDAKDKEISYDKLTEFRTKHPVLKKLFKLGETEIAKDAQLAYNYASDILKGRFLEGEEAIIKLPRTAALYAVDIIKGRWPEAETSIKKNSTTAYMYADEAIKQRWPEGEAAIAKTGFTAYGYAVHVLKDRFPAGEEAIIEDNYAEDYIDFLIAINDNAAAKEITKKLKDKY